MKSKVYLREIILKREEVSFDKYPFSLPAIRGLENLKLHPKVTFFIGENGSGKSTLLEALAISLGFNPEGGSKFMQFSTVTSHSELYKYLKLVKGPYLPKDGYFLRSESFFNVASEIDRYPDKEYLLNTSYGGKSLHEQSHGESFLALFMHRFAGEGIYILDEPEAALSPTRLLSMLTRLHQLVKLNSQFIIATHSPILMSYPNSIIYSFTENEIKQVDYKETDHYIITKEFLNNPENMLDILLNDEDTGQ